VKSVDEKQELFDSLEDRLNLLMRKQKTPQTSLEDKSPLLSTDSKSQFEEFCSVIISSSDELRNLELKEGKENTTLSVQFDQFSQRIQEIKKTPELHFCKEAPPVVLSCNQQNSSNYSFGPSPSYATTCLSN